MALQQSFLHLGFSLPDAYLKISSYNGDNKYLRFNLEIKATKSGVSLDTLSYSVSLDLEGPNPIKQAYLHLKTLPEFADAIDC
jgi:hypothetical protein